MYLVLFGITSVSTDIIVSAWYFPLARAILRQCDGDMWRRQRKPLVIILTAEEWEELTTATMTLI